MQILSRASADRNVSTLHRAGADFVISNASLGANSIFNYLRKEDTLLLTEGLNVFHLRAPETLIGKQLSASGIREETSCTVIAVSRNGKMWINPEADTVIKKDDELILIGTFDAEKTFLHEFGSPAKPDNV
mgnify:FL=1